MNLYLYHKVSLGIHGCLVVVVCVKKKASFSSSKTVFFTPINESVHKTKSNCFSIEANVYIRPLFSGNVKFVQMWMERLTVSLQATHIDIILSKLLLLHKKVESFHESIDCDKIA